MSEYEIKKKEYTKYQTELNLYKYKVSRHNKGKSSDSPPPNFVLWMNAHKVLTGAGVLAIVALVICASVTVSIATSIFRAKKVDNIKINDIKSDVQEILGKPYEGTKSDNVWEYYDKDALSVLKKIEKNDKKAEKTTDLSKLATLLKESEMLESQLDTAVYKYIKVSFGNDKVTEVLLDTVHCTSADYDTVKEVKNIVLSESSISIKESSDGTVPVYAQIYYTDGSYKLSKIPQSAFASVNSEQTGKVTIKWEDTWGEYSIFVDTYKMLFYLEDESYYLSSVTGKAISVIIPETYEGLPVVGISGGALKNCKTLKSITIPNSVTYIGSNAFEGCTELTSIIIPDSVISIGSDAFKNTAYYNDPSNWDNGFLYIGNHLIEAKSSITGAYEIVAGTKTIAGGVFSDYNKITSIIIPDSVISIGGSAFYGCAALTSITIPNSVISIGSYAFSGCTALTSITVPDSVTTIGFGAFADCSNLQSITLPFTGESINEKGYTHFGFIFGDDSGYGVSVIPSSLKTIIITTAIGNYAFENYTGLTSVTIGNSVTTIGNNAFENCTGLVSITIPDSVTSIGEYAFSGCSGLTSITIGNSVTSIGDKAFYDCTSLVDITIPDSVISIGEYAFSGCSGLTSVTIGNSVTSIGNYAFENCTGLVSITISDSVISIGDSAFSRCTGLTSVTIGNSVTSIGRYAFYYCSGLTSITIGKNVTSIGHSAFDGCSKIVEIYNLSGLTISKEDFSSFYYIAYYAKAIHTSLSEKSILTTDKDGYIFGYFDNKYYLLGYSGTSKDLTLPSNFIFNGNTISSYEIYQYAFNNCTRLTSITIPDSVTQVGSDAFYGCSGLTSVTIPNSVTSIGSSAFSSCTGLTNVTIGNGVTSIGGYAFYNCPGLTSVTFNNTSGWYITTTEGATSGISLTVTNTATNATNLTSTHYNYFWYRK